MKFRSATFFLLTIAVMISCKVDPKVVPTLPADHLEQIVPEGWPQPKYVFEKNPISQDGFILGRSLFYETMLSKDNTISCASCHQNFSAFANNDHHVSHGINNREGTRNSPGIFNVAWHPYFMHDGGINHIEMQPLGPISNTLEMGENINDVVTKLQGSEKYRGMFSKAFGDDTISSERMFKAMAQFMGLMLSAESKYDHYKKQQEEFTAQELQGYDLFIQKCSGCHTEPLFSDFKFRNNGLSIDPVYKDQGRANITTLLGDRYKFKTPSLRNVALTQPYMHDGRYKTLEECLDHYTNNIKNYTNLDPALESGIPMTPAEKKDIIAFLNTLSDFKFIADKRFADPKFQ